MHCDRTPYEVVRSSQLPGHGLTILLQV